MHYDLTDSSSQKVVSRKISSLKGVTKVIRKLGILMEVTHWLARKVLAEV